MPPKAIHLQMKIQSSQFTPHDIHQLIARANKYYVDLDVISGQHLIDYHDL